MAYYGGGSNGGGGYGGGAPGGGSGGRYGGGSGNGEGGISPPGGRLYSPPRQPMRPPQQQIESYYYDDDESRASYAYVDNRGGYAPNSEGYQPPPRQPYPNLQQPASPAGGYGYGYGAGPNRVASPMGAPPPPGPRSALPPQQPGMYGGGGGGPHYPYPAAPPPHPPQMYYPPPPMPYGGGRGGPGDIPDDVSEASAAGNIKFATSAFDAEEQQYERDRQMKKQWRNQQQQQQQLLYGQPPMGIYGNVPPPGVAPAAEKQQYEVIGGGLVASGVRSLQRLRNVAASTLERGGFGAPMNKGGADAASIRSRRGGNRCCCKCCCALLCLLILAAGGIALFVTMGLKQPKVSFAGAMAPTDGRQPLSLNGGSSVTINWDFMIQVTNPNSFGIGIADVQLSAFPSEQQTQPADRIANGSVSNQFFGAGATTPVTFPASFTFDLQQNSQNGFFMNLLQACGAPIQAPGQQQQGGKKKVNVFTQLDIGLSLLKPFGIRFPRKESQSFDCPINLSQVPQINQLVQLIQAVTGGGGNLPKLVASSVPAQVAKLPAPVQNQLRQAVGSLPAIGGRAR